MSHFSEYFDYIIVGAGSSGSAIAYRLSDAGHSVLVVEYGGTDMGPFIQMPAALSYPMNMGIYDWGYKSAPEPHLGGRRLACPRGKVIGGSSSINGMVYVRGHACDYDGWESLGARGWGFQDVLPYFLRLETAHLDNEVLDSGENGALDSSWRGKDGPLHIRRGSMNNPLYDAFITAGREAGYGETADYNGERQEGFGAMEMTVWRGRRWSSSNAYLRPALRRGNVALRTRSLVSKILLDNRRATGIEYSRYGRTYRVGAYREVILCAGSINSPHLLQLSGIGNGAHLRSIGIECIQDLPGVGENLQDHLELYIQMSCLKPVSLYPSLHLYNKFLIGLRWLLFKSGLGSSNHFEAAAFIRSRAGVQYPDIQYHFLPLAIRYDGTSPASGHGFQAHVGPMRSLSRGHVRARSALIKDSPEILFNYMSHDEDWVDFRRCIRLTREIFSQPAFASFRGEELYPGPSVVSDSDLDDCIRDGVESAYHACGTCRMGSVNDSQSVVDSECRVIGVENLRVADSSIMPQIPNGNLNGPSIMIGEKASDHILGKNPLSRLNLIPWLHPSWQDTQR